MKKTKRDFILNSVIEHYLKENLPVASSDINLQIGIAASTIRVYLKKLCDEGAISQLHVSGGRIPTENSMKNYWLKNLKFDKKISLLDEESLERISSNFRIYMMLFSSDEDSLINVINCQDKFIVLEFESGELAIKYKDKIYSCLSNLCGTTLKDLEMIARQIGLSELKTKLQEFKYSKVEFKANEEIAFEIFKGKSFKKLFEPSIISMLKENVIYEPFFNSGFMGLKLNVAYQGKNSTLFCASSLYENYLTFLEQIQEFT